MENSKPWYYRVIALFCAFLICSCLVVFSFLVPRVKAESIGDQFSDYIDDYYGEGAYALFQTVSTPFFPVLSAVMTGLEFVEVQGSNSAPISALYSASGFYRYDNKYHYCNSTVCSGDYFSADGGLCLAKSDNFEITATVTNDTSIAYVRTATNGEIGYTWYDSPYDYRTTWDSTISGGGAIFPTLNYVYERTGYGTMQSWCCTWDRTSIPVLTNFSEDSYTFRYFQSREILFGGLGDNSNFNWGDKLADLGIDSSTEVNPSNIYDFIINVLNPAVEENYPELTIYLFDPVEDTTGDTGGSGNCNCNHNIYVDVTCYYDPEINVYVTEYITVENNVEVELPSDWVQDYTLTTDPYEVDTIPIPTEENSEPVTMPTIDASEYEEAYGNAIDFWFYVAQSFIEKMHLQLIIAFAFALSVVGFCLWKLGGGGKE